MGYSYEYVKGDCVEDVIRYKNLRKTILSKEDVSSYDIQFNLLSKCVVLNNFVFMNMVLLQAINQQCKELGWLDE